jgi:DNA-binding NtrC family response regulator
MNAATILIVDDQQQVLRMAEVMLRAAGFEVHAASNATDALAIASQLGCGLNLLLTDMRMPDIDGHELGLLHTSQQPPFPDPQGEFSGTVEIGECCY